MTFPAQESYQCSIYPHGLSNLHASVFLKCLLFSLDSTAESVKPKEEDEAPLSPTLNKTIPQLDGSGDIPTKGLRDHPFHLQLLTIFFSSLLLL